MNDFFHKDEISQLNPKCPGDHCLPVNRDSFRWVFDNIEDARNFQSQAFKNPKILNDKKDIEKCAYYALSFFTSLDACKARFKAFNTMGDLAYKRFGTKIARGTLSENDGVSDKISATGHFDFHHVKDNELHKKFTIIDSL